MAKMNRKQTLKPSGLSDAARAAGARFHKAVAPEITPQVESFLEYIRRHVPVKTMPIVAICGTAGTGKTWVAKRLAESVYGCRAVLIDTTEENPEFFKGIANVIRYEMRTNLTIAQSTRDLVHTMLKIKRGLGRLYKRKAVPIMLTYELPDIFDAPTVPKSLRQQSDVVIQIDRVGKFPGTFWATIEKNRFEAQRRITFNITEPIKIPKV